MRSAKVKVHGEFAGILEELSKGTSYVFRYSTSYEGKPVSLTMPVRPEEYAYKTFPPFFEGLLPEGIQLEALLRQKKVDRNDFFSQLLIVGQDLVGAVTVESAE